MSAPIREEVAEGILTITIDRPQVLNALDKATHLALDAAWARFEGDPALRVAIVTGAGERAFCAGSDIKSYAGGAPIILPESGYAGLSHRKLAKPVIAAVNGLALGGGFEFALCCDLVIAADHAEFGLPEPLIGAAALGGGIPRLVRRIPYAIALGLILSSRRIGAAEAARIGLVNEVVPAAHLMETARGWARDIVRGAPLAIEASKRIAEDTLMAGEDFETLVGSPEDARQRRVIESEDCREGMAAFVEKRAPVWSGR